MNNMDALMCAMSEYWGSVRFKEDHVALKFQNYRNFTDFTDLITRVGA